MSEYFRKYIKQEHYPNPPYSLPHPAKISNSKHRSGTASIRDSTTDNGGKLMAMIGTSSGAKKNKSTGFFRSIGSNLAQRPITFEDGPNSAAKICSAKI